MKLKEFIVESEQQQLDELTAADVGRGVGKVAGGIGAVAGGVKGAWQAAKKGFEKGRATVAGEVPAAQAAAPEPAATAADANATGPKGTAKAVSQSGAGAAAMQKTAQAMDNKSQQQKNQTAYAQVKGMIGQLDKRGQQNILQLLQKSIQQTPAKPAAKPAAGGAAAGAGAFGQMAQSLAGGGQQQPAKPNTMANAPVSKTNTASPSNPNVAPAATPATTAAPATEPAATPAATPATTAAPAGRKQGGGKVPGQLSQTPAAVKKRQARAANKGGEAQPGANPSQAEIDADRDRTMGNFTDSVVRPGTSLEETLARKIEQQKRKMFETAVSAGKFKVFKQ